MKTRTLIVLAALIGLLSLAGCGQRGPLYLPTKGKPEAAPLEPVTPKRKLDQPS